MNYSNQQLIEIIRTRLSANRFEHSLRVADTAREMAEIFGEDSGKAYTTALLHDYAKGLSGQQLLDIAGQNGLLRHPVDRQVPDLLHAPVGAWLVQQELGVSDDDIIEAIANHTLGRIEMSPLEEIIFLADMIEPGRDYPGMERLKCLAMRSLPRGMLFGLDSTLRYCLDQGRIIHPRSVEVRNHYLQMGSSDLE